MTVTEVLLNLRAALRALIPFVERVGIPWLPGMAYDEWDAIASSLYDNLVVEVLQWYVPHEHRDSLALPQYDLLISDFTRLSTIEIVHPELAEGRWLFHAFGTETEAFDTVDARFWPENASGPANELIACRVEGAQFQLRLTFSDPNTLITELPDPRGCSGRRGR